MAKLAERRTKLRFTTDDQVRSWGTKTEKLENGQKGKPRRQVVHRPIIIEAHPRYVMVRLQGERMSYPISYEAIYQQAVKIAVAAEQREAKAAKKVKKSR